MGVAISSTAYALQWHPFFHVCKYVVDIFILQGVVVLLPSTANAMASCMSLRVPTMEPRMV